MIKRLFIVGLFTGFGHFVTLLSLKFITKNVEEDTIAFVGEIDSLSLLIVSIIAFGLQLSTIREIVLLDDWRKEFYTTQSARFTLSLFLILFSFFGVFYTKNYLFLIAPIIALNADYALYGIGKPITAASIALIRILIPSLTLVYSSIYSVDTIIINYSISILFAYLFSGLLVSKMLNVHYFIKPSINNLIKYLDSFRIGIASFAFFFIGIGIINIISYFYNEKSTAIIYLALKLYMIFKGIRRIIVQSFFKELNDDITNSVKIDYFAMIIGIIFLISLLLFQKTVISILYDQKYITYTFTFLILGISGFISSITTSSGIRLLLNKQDKAYSNNIIISAIVVVILSVTFFGLFNSQPYFISLSILIGELTLSILNIISIKEKNYLLNRIKIIYPIIIMSLLFIPIKHYFLDTFYTYVISLIIFGIITVVHTKKRLKFL